MRKKNNNCRHCKRPCLVKKRYLLRRLRLWKRYIATGMIDRQIIDNLLTISNERIVTTREKTTNIDANKQRGKKVESNFIEGFCIERKHQPVFRNESSRCQVRTLHFDCEIQFCFKMRRIFGSFHFLLLTVCVQLPI